MTALYIGYAELRSGSQESGWVGRNAEGEFCVVQSFDEAALLPGNDWQLAEVAIFGEHGHRRKLGEVRSFPLSPGFSDAERRVRTAQRIADFAAEYARAPWVNFEQRQRFHSLRWAALQAVEEVLS